MAIWQATEQKAMYVLNYAAIKSFLRRSAAALWAGAGDVCRKAQLNPNRDEPGTGFHCAPCAEATVLCGYLSDLLCVPISMPIEALVVQLQTRKPEISKAEVVRQALFTWEGLAMALKSGKAYFVLSLKPGIEFALFDRIKSMILKGYSKKELRPLTAFFLGAVARAVATCMVYPYVRGKALSQAKLAPNATAALRKVFAEEGVAALYRGLSMEIMRGMTQSAVMFAVMERIRLSVRAKLLRTNN
ncbi:Peroxisomal adenine nucleotide carrier 1 (GmPNC1) [Durusdinium trenchii]|uniref:Peroxisomal adenine nucleotide carrier 1 (GmPNC1) n=1 Tax=Durusdinium trenchii TaxID=1381693 RepID=A0ABP0M4W6_9DINO